MRWSASSCDLVWSLRSVLRTRSASSWCGMTNTSSASRPDFLRISTFSAVMSSFASSRISPVASSMRSWADTRPAGGLADEVLGPPPPQRGLRFLALPLERFLLVEELEDLAIRHEAQRAQQHAHRQLALAVDVDVHDVVNIVREPHPRAAVRDDARVVELLAVRVGHLVEEHARRTVELRHDDALRTEIGRASCRG